jgi:hypothetical protein
MEAAVSGTRSGVTPATFRGNGTRVSWRAISLAIAMSLGAWLVPSIASAQPSPFAPAPNPAPGTAPPPPGPAVPPPSPKSPPDTTSGASPPVADAIHPATGSATGPPPAPGALDATPEPPPSAEEIAADGPRFAIGAGGHVAFGSAPAVAVGVRVSAEVATGRWSLGLEGRYDLPASAHTTQGGTARTTLLGGAFVPCVRAKGTWACGVVMASRVSWDARGPTGPSASDASLFVGIGARLVMHFSLPLDFALRVGGEVLGHPVPFEVVANGGRVFKSSVVSTMIGPAIVRAF